MVAATQVRYLVLFVSFRIRTNSMGPCAVIVTNFFPLYLYLYFSYIIKYLYTFMYFM